MTQAVAGSESWDVVIAGAGPGGSTAAAVLAAAGVRVLVLEKEEFPRFHIGESLLPAVEVLRTVLGIEPSSDVFLHKQGAQFVCEQTGRIRRFDFAEALPGPQRYAWHVDRALFDSVLRDRARALGAQVRHGVRVADVEWRGDRVHISSSDGTHVARYFIDATGQGRLLASKLQSIQPYQHFGKAAVFTHFEGLSPQAWDELGPGNDIRIVMVPEGWAWLIPLPQDRLSVGIVSRERGLKRDHLDSFLQKSPFVQRWTRHARRDLTRMVGNFSFKNTKSHGVRYACVGDAACFIDPVFSSGVSLAISQGIHVAQRLVSALCDSNEGAPDLMDEVLKKMDRAYDTFLGLVYRFYNTRIVDNLILSASADGNLRPGVISVLAGDVFRDDNPFQRMLLSARRADWQRPTSSRRQGGAKVAMTSA